MFGIYSVHTEMSILMFTRMFTDNDISRVWKFRQIYFTFVYKPNECCQ